MNTTFYRILALVYLAPIAIMHLITNTTATGLMADMSSILFGVTIAMMIFTALPWIGGAIGVNVVKARPFEWIFNAALLAFCIATFFMMRELNATSNSGASIFALIWEWMSIGVAVIAGIAFWAVKGETIRHHLADDQQASSTTQQPARKTTF